MCEPSADSTISPRESRIKPKTMISTTEQSRRGANAKAFALVVGERPQGHLPTRQCMAQHNWERFCEFFHAGRAAVIGSWAEICVADDHSPPASPRDPLAPPHSRRRRYPSGPPPVPRRRLGGGARLPPRRSWGPFGSPESADHEAEEGEWGVPSRTPPLSLLGPMARRL